MYQSAFLRNVELFHIKAYTYNILFRSETSQERANRDKKPLAKRNERGEPPLQKARPKNECSENGSPLQFVKKENEIQSSTESLGGSASSLSFDLNAGYVPTVAEKQTCGEKKTQQQKPSWLFDAPSAKEKTHSAGSKKKSSSILDDFFDDLAFDEKESKNERKDGCNRKNGDAKFGRRGISKKNNGDENGIKRRSLDAFPDEDKKGTTRPGQSRQRGQTGTDAASELKKICSFGF